MSNPLSRPFHQKPLIVIRAELTAPPCPSCGSAKTIVFGTLDGYRNHEFLFECCNEHCAFAKDEAFQGFFTLDDVSIKGRLKR